MRLKAFKIEGLFGLFNHEIHFQLDERITIIHAPNGYGKTVVLKMIEGFFGGSLAIFRHHEYRQVVFTLENNSTIVVTQESAEPELFEENRRDQKFRTYRIRYLTGDEELIWDPQEARLSAKDSRRHLHWGMLSEYVPYLRRHAPGEWRDLKLGDIISTAEAANRYWDYLPAEARGKGPHPEWLEKLRFDLSCRLIETQRLTVTKAKRESRESEIAPAVRSYAEELAGAMARALEDSASLSQSLDRTFPNRLLSRRHKSERPLTEGVLRTKLTELEQLRVRLTKAGILDKPDEDALIPTEGFDVQTRRILTEYVSDAKKKLSVYDQILNKIELFIEILNSRFQFKTIRPDRTRGFVIADYKGRDLDVAALSSGEQHELVLTYDLIFKTRRNALILVDEPEISLHVAWQKRFIADIKKIISLSQMDVVLATHSPQLIGGYLNLTVPLSAPSDVYGDV